MNPLIISINKNINYENLYNEVKQLYPDVNRVEKGWQNTVEIHFDNDFSGDLNDILTIITNHDGDSYLRIYDLVDDNFKNYPTDKIDFRKHLKKDVHLQKDVVMLPNGRPSYAVYKFNNELIARIDFVFELNQLELMTRRKEVLYYYNTANVLKGGFIISDEMYDILNSQYHQTKVLQESSQCRINVIESTKAILNLFLRQYYSVNDPVNFNANMLNVANFFKTYNDSIETWIKTGLNTFALDIQSDTSYQFLNLSFQTNLSVREYILYRITA